MSAKAPTRYTVLMVDDSDDDLFMIRRCLKKLPRAAILAELHNGSEAKNYLLGAEPFSDRKKHPLPDLVILDWKMPICGGWEVLQKLKAEPIRGLVVVVLSGSWLQENHDQAILAGAHGYWPKASKIEDQLAILLEIETVFDRHRLR